MDFICSFTVGFIVGVFVMTSYTIKQMDRKDNSIKKLGMENQSLRERGIQ